MLNLLGVAYLEGRLKSRSYGNTVYKYISVRDYTTNLMSSSIYILHMHVNAMLTNYHIQYTVFVTFSNLRAIMMMHGYNCLALV